MYLEFMASESRLPLQITKTIFLARFHRLINLKLPLYWDQTLTKMERLYKKKTCYKLPKIRQKKKKKKKNKKPDSHNGWSSHLLLCRNLCINTWSFSEAHFKLEREKEREKESEKDRARDR